MPLVQGGDKAGVGGQQGGVPEGRALRAAGQVPAMRRQVPLPEQRQGHENEAPAAVAAVAAAEVDALEYRGGAGAGLSNRGSPGIRRWAEAAGAACLAAEEEEEEEEAEEEATDTTAEASGAMSASSVQV